MYHVTGVVPFIFLKRVMKNEFGGFTLDGYVPSTGTEVGTLNGVARTEGVVPWEEIAVPKVRRVAVVCEVRGLTTVTDVRCPPVTHRGPERRVGTQWDGVETMVEECFLLQSSDAGQMRTWDGVRVVSPRVNVDGTT